ncbi:MAG: radical SAM protein [Chloroflexi bacterium]|nr:radical SAM protein [Chloroflexota bacterium]
MNFETPPYRPPSEAYSLLVRATRNCSWNRCTFCYGVHWNRDKLELRSVNEIKHDILAMKTLADETTDWAEKNGYGDRVGEVALSNGLLWLTNEGVKTAFIGDSDSLIMKAADLVEVITFLYEAFPSLERVTSYARAKTVLRKTPFELKQLNDAGLTRLHLGLETGDDELLTFIDKGATAEEMIEGGKRVKEAGISLSEYVILGIGGQARWKEHAEGTARVLNATDPDFIRVRTLIVFPGTPLQQAVDRGEFNQLSSEEVLREERLLIELLDVNSEFVSDHVSNYVSINGKLPENKREMLSQLDAALGASPAVEGSILHREEHP